MFRNFPIIWGAGSAESFTQHLVGRIDYKRAAGLDTSLDGAFNAVSLAIGDLNSPSGDGIITPYWMRNVNGVFPLFRPLLQQARGGSEQMLVLGVNRQHRAADRWLFENQGIPGLLNILQQLIPVIDRREAPLPESIEANLLTSLNTLGEILEQSTGNILSRNLVREMFPEFR
jgi:hypothetical protein